MQKYNKIFYQLVILNLKLDIEIERFPGMRQALRALEVGTPEVPSRFLEIKNLRNLHPNFKFTIGLGWWLLFLSRFENICWRRWTLCTSARSAWTSSGEFCFWLFCFFLVNVERLRLERNEIERIEFLHRSLANLIAHKRSYCQEKFEVRYIFTSHLILCSHHVASSLLLLSKITYLHRYVHWIRPTRELPTSLTRWLGWKPPSFRLLSSRPRRCVVVVVVGGGVVVVEAKEVRCVIIISICCHNAVVILIYHYDVAAAPDIWLKK